MFEIKFTDEDRSRVASALVVLYPELTAESARDTVRQYTHSLANTYKAYPDLYLEFRMASLMDKIRDDVNNRALLDVIQQHHTALDALLRRAPDAVVAAVIAATFQDDVLLQKNTLRYRKMRARPQWSLFVPPGTREYIPDGYVQATGLLLPDGCILRPQVIWELECPATDTYRDLGNDELVALGMFDNSELGRYDDNLVELDREVFCSETGEKIGHIDDKEQFVEDKPDAS